MVKNLEDMFDAYNVAMNEKDAKLKILRELWKDYKQKKEQVFDDIKDASQAAAQIEKIALGKSLLTSVDYIERLIESERRSNRPNKANRFSQILKHFFYYFFRSLENWDYGFHLIEHMNNEVVNAKPQCNN